MTKLTTSMLASVILQFRDAQAHMKINMLQAEGKM